MIEEVKPKVVTHGIYWIMGAKKQPACPECQGNNHFIEVEKVAKNVIIITATCTCNVCGCKFTVSKEEK